jgi:hypothetical protein
MLMLEVHPGGERRALALLTAERALAVPGSKFELKIQLHSSSRLG